MDREKRARVEVAEMGAKRASKNAKQRAREGKEGAALPGGGRGLEWGGGNHTLEVLRSLPPDGCSLSKVVVLKIGAVILIECFLRLLQKYIFNAM